LNSIGLTQQSNNKRTIRQESEFRSGSNQFRRGENEFIVIKDTALSGEFASKKFWSEQSFNSISTDNSAKKSPRAMVRGGFNGVFSKKREAACSFSLPCRKRNLPALPAPSLNLLPPLKRRFV
jgi:hypothetical protein